MESILCQQVNSTPDALAVTDGSRTLTYMELLVEADRLADALRQRQLGPEEPVCIFTGIGAGQVIAQVAVLRAGGTSVPIDPSTPKLRVIDMLEDIGAKHVITDQGEDLQGTGFNIIPLTPRAGNMTNGHRVLPRSVNLRTKENENYRSHILFTSGSTGKPKAVQIPGRGIIHVATRTPMTPLEATDRVTQINSPGFDLSLFEIWASLLCGASIVVVPRDVATDPFALRGFIREKGVTVLFMTTSLFGITAFACPTAFQGVRHLLTAGEAANAAAMRQVLLQQPHGRGPENLWNCYGPTEATVFATAHLVRLEDTDTGNIPIGRPAGESLIYLLDETLTPGQEGEICIGGPGMSLGYINRPAENERHFLDVKAAKLGHGERRVSSTVRLFRTGDMARWQRRGETDLLEFIGRVDTQVKQGGFRVELGEIEQTLVSSGWLKAAVVLQLRSGGAEGGEPVLVAFVIPSIADQIRQDNVLSYAKERLPSYMIPHSVVFRTDLPLTANGKVDRKALAESYQQSQPITNGVTNGTTHVHDKGAMTAIVKNIWTELLNRGNFDANDDFFLLGASSMQAAALIGKIWDRTGKRISMRALTEHSRFSDLVSYIEHSVEGGDAPDETARWAADSKLADDLELVPDWLSEKEGRVFITGVTGFLGAHLLGRLLGMPGVKEIVCLARSRGSLTASERVQRALERYDLWTNSLAVMQKLTVLEGDITDETLGLGREKFHWLADWASVIFHLAAKVNFCESYASHYLPNVVGTKNVLRVATTGRRKGFHYLSTIDAWGATGLVLGTRSLQEDEPLAPHLHGVQFDIGYAQSQWVAEQMVRRLRNRGLPVSIYRPGTVIGDSGHGVGNPDDFFARFIVGCIRLGKYPHLPNQRLEYVTADYVCSAVLHIASSNANLGRSYSLVSPDPARSVNFDKTHAIINETGYPVEMIPYDDFVRLLRESKDTDPQNPLLPLLPLLQEPVLGRLSRLQTSRYTPHYVATNTLAALADAPSIQYVPFDRVLLRKFLDFWNRKGFYRV